MKNERLLDVLGQVDEKYIMEAAPGPQKNRKNRKWIVGGSVASLVTMAACACLVICVGIQAARIVPFMFAGIGSSEDTAKAPAMDNAYQYAESVKSEAATSDGAMAENTAGAVASEAPEETMEANLGITLSVENVTSTGLTLVCIQSGGEPTGSLQTGSEFKLEVLENGEWMAVPYLNDNIAWTAIAHLIPMEDSISWEINWERLYGELSEGTYRIKKNIMDFRGTGDYDEEDFYVEFTISNS